MAACVVSKTAGVTANNNGPLSQENNNCPLTRPFVRPKQCNMKQGIDSVFLVARGGAGMDGEDDVTSSGSTANSQGKGPASSPSRMPKQPSNGGKRKRKKKRGSSSTGNQPPPERTEDCEDVKAQNDEFIHEKPSTSKSPSHSPKGQESSTSTSNNDNARNDSGLSEVAQKILKETNYYSILGLSPSSKSQISSIHIKKAFRRRAVQTHPDKMPNGDRRVFDKVSEAYDVLSDESKRNLYDRFGERGVKNSHSAGFGGGGSANAFQDQILRSFFGSSSGSSGGFSSRMSQHFKARNHDVKYELHVSLEEMYRGAHQKVSIAQPQGRGQKMVEVSIPQGISAGQSVILPGEVDHVHDATPGDIIFIIGQNQHPVFTRKGFDLAMELKISLREAICGFDREFVHLDGRKVHIGGPCLNPMSTLNGDINDSATPLIIQTGDVHVLKGEGMPVKGARNKFGDLYVQYSVAIPSSEAQVEENLTPAERKRLSQLLDKLEGNIRKVEDNQKDYKDIRLLQKATASDFGRSMFQSSNDDEEHLSTDQEDPYQKEGFHFFSNSQGANNRGRSFFSSSGAGFPGFSNFQQSSDDGDVQCQQM
jgi:DnaJ-class molecular chaperone